MDFGLFFIVFIALVVISTYITSVINVDFAIKGSFTRKFTSWVVALWMAALLWSVCKMCGCELPLHFSLVAIGLAAASNGFYDLRYC